MSVQFGNMIRGARQGFRYFKNGFYLQVTEVDGGFWKWHFCKNVPVQKAPVEHVVWWDVTPDDWIGASTTLHREFCDTKEKDEFILILDECGREARGL